MPAAVFGGWRMAFASPQVSTATKATTFTSDSPGLSLGALILMHGTCQASISLHDPFSLGVPNAVEAVLS